MTTNFEHIAPPLTRCCQLWRNANGDVHKRPITFRESVIPFGNKDTEGREAEF
jgi:hypothetical protein